MRAATRMRMAPPVLSCPVVREEERRGEGERVRGGGETD